MMDEYEITINETTASMLSVIADSEDDAFLLVKLGEVDPDEFRRFMADTGESDNKNAQEILEAAESLRASLISNIHKEDSTMNAVRFSLGKMVSPSEHSEIKMALMNAAPGQIMLSSSGPTPGAALVDIVLVALISGGATVLATAISAFATYINNRKQQSSDEHPAFVIIVRGTEASHQIEFVNGQIDNEKIEKVVKEAGTVTEVAMGKQN